MILRYSRISETKHIKGKRRERWKQTHTNTHTKRKRDMERERNIKEKIECLTILNL